MNSINRHSFQQSVAANPQLWKEAVQKYRAEANNADNVLQVMQDGGGLNYHKESGNFVPSQRQNPLTGDERIDIVSTHRERLLQRLLLRVTKLREEQYLFYTDKKVLITNVESTKRMFDFLNYKLNYANQPPDNYHCEPRRLTKLFDKLLQEPHRIKEQAAKDAKTRRRQDQTLNAAPVVHAAQLPAVRPETHPQVPGVHAAQLPALEVQAPAAQHQAANPEAQAPKAASVAPQAPNASSKPKTNQITAFFKGIVNRIMLLWKAFLNLIIKNNPLNRRGA